MSDLRLHSKDFRLVLKNLGKTRFPHPSLLTSRLEVYSHLFRKEDETKIRKVTDERPYLMDSLT